MKVLIINSVCGIKSTGRIATEIADYYIQKGDTVRVAYGREETPDRYQDISIKITSNINVYMNAIQSRIFDNDGFSAYKSTVRFLKWAEEYDPDLLWLHNLHGYYINVELLFKWIKTRPNMIVKWTFHDCWPFTGHCTYFSFVGCEKWKTACINCPQKNSYPKSILLDNSASNFAKKKEAFLGVPKMEIITPSEWLSGLVSQSFLQHYPTRVIRNRISDEFKPLPSDVLKNYGINNQFVILGVAAQWTPRKGLSDFVKLRSLLDERFTLVLVGLTNKQISELPKGILGLEKTNSIQELAMLYTAADIYFNPTYEDNYPTTNLEAKACGTPVITYKTGGSPESVPSDNVFKQGDLDSVVKRINELLL